jgi:hypothetical protein
VYVGQWVRIEFSGGMLIAPTGQQCGDDFTILFPNMETAEATTREVQLKLNDQVIFTQRCGYTCVLEFIVPIMAHGNYEWELTGVWDARRFPVMVDEVALT